MRFGRLAKLAGLVVLPLAALVMVAPAYGGVAPQLSGVRIDLPSFVRIGVPFGLTFESDGTAVKFVYTVNGGKAHTVHATGGTATATVTFRTHVNFVTAEGFAADGSTEFALPVDINADGVTPPAPADSNSDGVADLLTVGDPTGIGSGIWLATGRPGGTATGRVRASAVNVGANGFGSDGPSFYDGSRVFTGNFLDDNLQDVITYFPSGFKQGGGLILAGTGDGSLLNRGESEVGLPNGLLTDLNGDNPVDLADGYNADGNDTGIDDLIGVSGSDTDGYHLAFYPGLFGPGIWDIPRLLSNPTPAGGTDWNNWRLATTVLPSGAAVFLWDRVTGALYLWEGLALTDNGDFTGSMSFTQYEIAQGWNAGADLPTLEAVDFTGDGVPDLWAVTPAGVVTAYVVTGLSMTGLAHIAAKRPQALTPAA